MNAPPVISALAVNGSELRLLRLLVRQYLECQPEDDLARGLAQMLHQPLLPGELQRAFGDGESYEPGHRYGADYVKANGSGRA